MGGLTSGLDFVHPSHFEWHIHFYPSAVLFFLEFSKCIAVCQKQIVVPNNSLLYCSEKCKHEDTLSSSPPWSSSLPTSSELSSMKVSSFEPSRKDQWGITPSSTPGAMIPPSSATTGTSPPLLSFMRRSSLSRPLPPLHPRTNGTSPRSMELVLPVYRGTSTAAATESKGLDYCRRMVDRSITETGGLKKLFHFKELQTNPDN